MSLLPAKNCKEANFQYCIYGYDKTKFSSMDDCIAKLNANCLFNEPTQVNPKTSTVSTMSTGTIALIAAAIIIVAFVLFK